MNTSNKKIVTGIGWTFGERILAKTISLIVSIVLARLLEPSHYGIIAIVSVFISFLDAFVSGGFGSALVQKKNADDLDFNTICCFSISLSILLYALLYIAAPYIARFYNLEQLVAVTRILGLRIIVSSFNSIQHAYVQRHMIFKRFFFSTLGGTIVSAIVGITMAYLGYGVWAFVGQYLSNSIIDTIVLLFTIEWKPRLEWSVSRLKTMIGFGFKMLGATLVNTLQDNIRSLVVGKVFTKEDLAYYNQGKKYPSTIMNNLVGSVQKVMFPAFSESQQDRENIKNMMRKSIRLSSFILVPVVVGMISMADTFILLLLTEKWAPAIPYLQILSLIYLTRTMDSIFQSGLLAIGKSGLNMIHEIVESVLSLTMIYLGAFIMRSVIFIAWSYVIVMIVGTGIFMWFVSEHFHYTFVEIMKDFLPYIALSLIMGAIIYLLKYMCINKLILFILQFTFGIIIYICLARLTKVQELNTCTKMIQKLKNRFVNKHE